MPTNPNETSFWRMVLATTSDAVCYLDAQGRYRHANPAALQVLDRALEDVLDRTWLEMGLASGSMSQFEAQRLQVMTTGEALTAGIAFHSRGEWRHFEYVISPVKQADDTVIGIYAVARDVTERKLIETRLAQLTRFHDALSHARQAMLHVSSADQLFERICAILIEHGHLMATWIVLFESGRDLRIAAHRGAAEFIELFPVDLDPTTSAGCGSTAQAIREGRYHVHMLQGAPADARETLATRIGIQASAAFPIQQDGEVIGTLGVLFGQAEEVIGDVIALLDGLVRDMGFALTALRDRQALQESRQLLEEAQQIAQVGHWSMGVDSRLVAPSAMANVIFGRPRTAPLVPIEEIIAILHPQDRHLLSRAVDDLCALPQPVELDYRIMPRPDEVRWIHSRYSVTVDAAGRPQCVFGTVQDVTEPLLAERALRESEAHLAEAQRLAKLGHWSMDVASRMIDASREAKRVWGRDPEAPQISVYEVLEDLVPEDVPMIRAATESSMGEGLPAELEYRLALPNDGVRWIFTRFEVARDAQDRPQRVFGIVQDISERKQAEQALRESEALRTVILDSIRDAIIAVDAEHRVVLFNQAAEQMHGLTQAQIIGQPVTCLIPGQRWNSYFDYVRAIEAGQVPAGEFRRGKGMRSDGSEFPAEISITRAQLDGHTLYNLVVRDISVQEKADRELRLLAQVFKASAEAIGILDAERRLLSINPAFTYLTGYAAGEAVGQTMDLLHASQQEPGFYQKIWDELSGAGAWQGEVWYRHRSGREFAAWLSLSQVTQQNGRSTHYVMSFSDITERKHNEERIRYMAGHDALTGLPNRLTLDALLTHAIAGAQRGDWQVAILFLDLDRFKTVNDSLGHHVGDLLLQAVAQRLRGCLRQSDIVARQGGDEFIIVIPGVHSIEHEVLVVAQHVLDAVARPYQVNDMELTITPSIGISLYPGDGMDIPTLIKHADAAMYAAKEAGRGSIRFFSREMAERARERLSLENQLRGALARGELMLYYQPQIDLRSGRVVAVEALLRWFHPELGTIPPGIFIPVAEESGLIVPIGRWVIQEACRQNRLWQQADLPAVPMAVNLSALQFEQQRLDEIVNTALTETGLAACWLELELTEGILIRDVEGALRMLETLKQRGVRLAVDDFGIGYSSLNYLKRFPLDKLKIDRSFVMDLVHDHHDAAITGAIIGLGHHLGLQVVAEGVETQEQLALLQTWGCDGIQGNLILPASPPQVVEGLLGAGRAMVGQLRS